MLTGRPHRSSDRAVLHILWLCVLLLSGLSSSLTDSSVPKSLLSLRVINSRSLEMILLKKVIKLKSLVVSVRTNIVCGHFRCMNTFKCVDSSGEWTLQLCGQFRCEDSSGEGKLQVSGHYRCVDNTCVCTLQTSGHWTLQVSGQYRWVDTTVYRSVERLAVATQVIFKGTAGCTTKWKQTWEWLLKNPAYGRQSISWPMRIVAPIPQQGEPRIPQNPIFFYGKNHPKRKNSKTSKTMPKLAIRPLTRGL